MPRVTDLNAEIIETGVHVLMLNHATALINTEATQVVASSSTASFLDMDENESWSHDEPKGHFPVAVTTQSGQGMVVIISDPSIIISSMVDRDDNYRFIEYFTGYNDEAKGVLIDRSHLSKTPLDVSKLRLIDTRAILSSPYALVGITAVIFVIVSRYTLPKGESSG